MATSAACRLDSNSTRRRHTTHPCTHARNRAWTRARARSFSTHHHIFEETFMQLICDSELLLTRNVCRLRAVMPTQTHPEPLAPLTPQICARAAPYHPRFASHRLHPRHTFLSFSRSPQLAAPTDHRRLRSRYTRSDHQRARGSAYHITRARSSTVNVSARTGLQNRTETAGRDDFRSSERHHHFSLCVFRLRCCCLAPPCRALELAPRAAPRSRSCR